MPNHNVLSSVCHKLHISASAYLLTATTAATDIPIISITLNLNPIFLHLYFCTKIMLQSPKLSTKLEVTIQITLQKFRESNRKGRFSTGEKATYSIAQPLLHAHTHTHTHRITALFRDYPGKPVPER